MVTYDGAASGNISWTASENKTTEKKTSAFSISIQDAVLNTNLNHLLQIDRNLRISSTGTGISTTAGMITTNVYNVSKIDGTNSRDTLFVTQTCSTTQQYKSSLLGQGVLLGTEGQIKIGMKFAANVTGSNGVASIAYRIYRI